MIQRVLSILAVSAAGMLPATVQAADIRVASYEMSDTGGIVMLESDEQIGEPWLRIDAQGVRIWFPNVDYVARFDHVRDAKDPIRSLQLRPGASDSAVLRLELGSGKKLSRDEIEITRTGSTARVQVRFAAPARAATAAAAPATAAAAASARPAPQPSAATAKPLQLHGAATANAAPIAQAAPNPPQAAASSTPAPSTAAPVHTLASVASTATPELGLAQGGASNLGGLLLISGVLCGVYLAIRAYGKKRQTRSSDIQVLSAHRLGHRSELMVVRALGADHLLVSSAGRVERVASVPTPLEALEPTPAAAPSAPEGAPAEAQASQANGLGIISKLSSSYRVKKLLDAVDRESSDPAEADPARPHAFGPELMSAINQHKLANLSALRPLAKQSDAVAGIARLRAGGPRAN